MEIGKLRQLYQIHLSNNLLRWLPSHFEQLTKLLVIDLSNNLFLILPLPIVQFIKNRHLCLTKNPLKLNLLKAKQIQSNNIHIEPIRTCISIEWRQLIYHREI